MENKPANKDSEKIKKGDKHIEKPKTDNEDEQSAPIIERKNYSERSHGRKHDSPLGGANPKGLE